MNGHRNRDVFGLATMLVALVAPAQLAQPVPAQAVAGPVAVDRAVAAGVYEVNHLWEATPVDYDRDGDEDVWIGYHQ